MTDSTASRDPIEQACEFERIIAETMWSIRPTDVPWDYLEYTANEIGGSGSSIAKMYYLGKPVKRLDPDDAVLLASLKLREIMYQPNKGTWFSMILKVTRKGDSWEADYNYTEKPVWELGEPVNDTYAQELYLFPRDEEHVPEWFKEEMNGATWTPEAA